ncbi:spore coat protein CotH [Rhodococcus sp. HNM0563]|uniref:CotH kinase family protein n=1 Tax=Rhodococcus sp. HNM0563 TaxID=2716339 RepID=UPI00146EC68F|nr:CotH kinase family protein [Rhodococcus sp. HNM0563]NLU61582.1 spore coat protein CotH [Rhodococcus sp. HNM0563]
MDEPTTGPRKRLRHKIPTSLRQHWTIAVALVAFVALVGTVFGAARIRPYITGDATVITSDITENIEGTVDLFDTSVEHEVSLEISDVEYNDMVDSYVDDGEKEWVTADITIDGTLITDVGVRLKGNSTLSALRGGMGGGPGGEDGGFRTPEGMELPEGFEISEDFDPAAMFGGGGGMPGMGGTSISVDDPTSLPLLIDFSKNVDGRAYQGMTQLSVRPGSPVLNEAMALSLTAATDQATQRYAYSVYSVNDSATATRLLLEHPDESYANSLFDSDGYLYKADASSKFAYVGDDQADYTDQFKQLNAEGTGDVQPIISFLKWMDSASDEEFDAHLADWVDVDSFAQYVATQNLLVNSDDMSGPGQNYYLWYDLDTEKISVVSWDLNMAMQGGTTAGPNDTVSMGGGMAPPEGMALPEGMARPNRGDGGGPSMGGNTLKTRFLASEAFTEVYEAAYWDLYEQMYGSGQALEILDGLASSVPVSDGLTAESLQSSVDSMRTWIQQRTDALAAI